MFTILMVVELIFSILLILVILMQSSKGGGLAGTFGGGGSVGMMFGVRRTSDFLTRATQILAGGFLALALVINIFFLPRGANAGTESVLQKNSSSRGVATPQLPPPQAPPITSPQGGGK